MEMNKHKPDPMAVIAEVAPEFSHERAIAIMREHYGLDVSVKVLVSERDQNFEVTAKDGLRFVLKIANAAEPRDVTRFQIEALKHIAAVATKRNMPVLAPRIVATRKLADHILVTLDDVEYLARVVTYLEGVPLAGRTCSPVLARRMGSSLAWLGLALRDFSYPGGQQSLLWDMQAASGLRDLLEHVQDRKVAGEVAATIDDFETHALPKFPALRSQVVHNDFNPDNVLVHASDRNTVAGVIDFGDMLLAPLIADVAIGACYLRVAAGNPLTLIVEFLAGYHEVCPLSTAETDILFELIQTRLCASIVILEWRSAARGADDPYLEKLNEGELSARAFLHRLREIPRQNAQQIFRQVCASIAAATRD